MITAFVSETQGLTGWSSVIQPALRFSDILYVNRTTVYINVAYRWLPIHKWRAPTSEEALILSSAFP